MSFHRTSLLVLAALFVSRAAYADDPEKLFSDGTALMQAGKYAEALPKFEQAQKLDPGIGTQFNIAVCHEKLGKPATAYREYAAVRDLARASGKKAREDASREKLEALRSKLPLLNVRVEERGDVTLKIDGAEVKREEWSSYPVDPGSHTVDATASAKKPWSTKVDAPAAGQKLDVVVPVLEVAKETKVVTVTKTNGRRTIGFIAGGIGLVGFAAAGVTGAMLLGDHSTAEKDCTQPIPGDSKLRCTTAEGRDAVNESKTLLPINAIAFGVGIVGVAAGAVLILTSGKTDEKKVETPKTAVLPSVGPGGAGVLVMRRF